MEVYTLEEKDGCLIGVFDSIATIREFYREDDSEFPERYIMTDEEYKLNLEEEEIYACLTKVFTRFSFQDLEPKVSSTITML